jgi:ribosome maturation factor RimP
MKTAQLPFTDETAERLRARLGEMFLELCHVEWNPGRRGKLTLFIDREGGVTLEDCETASRAASELLDALDGTPGELPAYVLEVSSPGLDRPLWTLADCERYTGSRVDVRLARKVEGSARLKGLLEKVGGGALTVLDEDRKRRYTVSFGDVKVARLVPGL